MGLPSGVSPNLLSVIIICRNTSRMERVGQFLVQCGYPTKVFDSLKPALKELIETRPRYVFVSWNINSSPRKLIRSINQTFKMECIPFAEWPDRDTSKAVARSGYANIMLYPVSGQGVQRLIERLENAKVQKDDIKNLSKIQIKCSPDDIPSEGRWLSVPGRKKVWFFETEVKARLFGKKNGRFVYQGETIPEKLQNGKWKADLIKGKLDFEIINTFETKKTRDLIEAQSNLTDEETIQKFSNSLGQTVDDFDRQILISLSEEEVYQDEITKDQQGQEVDSLMLDIAKNLEEGFLEKIQKENEEKRNKIFMEQARDLEGYEDNNEAYNDAYDNDDDEGNKLKNETKSEENKNKSKTFSQQQRGGGISIIKGKKNKNGIIIQEREQHKDYSEVKEGFKEQEYKQVQKGSQQLDYNEAQNGDVDLDYDEVQNGDVALGNARQSYGANYLDIGKTQNHGNVTKSQQTGKYEPRLCGAYTNLAKEVHAAHMNHYPTIDVDPKKITTTKQVAVMCFDNRKLKGYFVMATSKYEEYSNEELKVFHDHIAESVKELGMKIKDGGVAIVDTPEFDFIGWMVENSQFSSFVQNGENESVIAFVPAGREMPTLEAEGGGHMVPIETNSILAGTKLTFDLYLFLEKNQKFILYVKRNDHVLSRQLDNLQQKQMNRFFIRIENAAAYRLYCAKFFIKTQIENSKKYLIAG